MSFKAAGKKMDNSIFGETKIMQNKDMKFYLEFKLEISVCSQVVSRNGGKYAEKELTQVKTSTWGCFVCKNKFFLQRLVPATVFNTCLS